MGRIIAGNYIIYLLSTVELDLESVVRQALALSSLRPKYLPEFLSAFLPQLFQLPPEMGHARQTAGWMERGKRKGVEWGRAELGLVETNGEENEE